MNTIGERIQHLRENANLTQKELAHLIGITDATMSRYENNKREPKAEIVCKIANHFNISTDYILGNVPNKENKFYSTTLSNSIYTIKLDKNLKKDLTKEELDNFMNYLIDVGFDIEKALEKSNKNK